MKPTPPPSRTIEQITERMLTTPILASAPTALNAHLLPLVLNLGRKAFRAEMHQAILDYGYRGCVTKHVSEEDFIAGATESAQQAHAEYARTKLLTTDAVTKLVALISESDDTEAV